MYSEALWGNYYGITSDAGKVNNILLSVDGFSQVILPGLLCIFQSMSRVTFLSPDDGDSVGSQNQSPARSEL